MMKGEKRGGVGGWFGGVEKVLLDRSSMVTKQQVKKGRREGGSQKVNTNYLHLSLF